MRTEQSPSEVAFTSFQPCLPRIPKLRFLGAVQQPGFYSHAQSRFRYVVREWRGTRRAERTGVIGAVIWELRPEL